ncbi:MAG: NADH-quinone oxidoreductase subunit N [Chloroflexi bacterium]|nr:NADH-quinone oxidoreductase subunit N [Chloroflexota bacterium]
MNWALALPEFSLAGAALVLIALDLLGLRRGILVGVSVGGLLLSMALGGALWGEAGATAFSGMLVVDQFALFFKLFFPAVAILVVLASADYVGHFPRFQGEYYALILLSTLGMMFMAGTGELVSIYISLELTAVSLYVLAGFLKDERSSEAGLKYLLLGAIASAVLLYGMALVFGLTGKTGLLEVAGALRGAEASPALYLGVVLLVAGLGFKIASVPFQMWVPDVYEGAPTPITAYLSVASKAAGFALVLRLFSSAFGAPSWLAQDWGMLFAVLAAITMTVGNFLALVQTNINRLLGYSSIAHAGYIMMGLAAVGLGGEALGKSGVLFYLLAYGVTNLAAFIAVIAISERVGSDLIAGYSGMARRSPALALALAVGLVSLIGLPPTAGFVAKVYIFNSALQQGLAWLVVIAVLNSAVSAYYYLGVVKSMYLGQPSAGGGVSASWPVSLALGLCSVGVLVMGIFPTAFLRLAEAAIRMLTS